MVSQVDRVMDLRCLECNAFNCNKRLKDSFGTKTNFDTIGSNEDEPEEIKR